MTTPVNAEQVEAELAALNACGIVYVGMAMSEWVSVIGSLQLASHYPELDEQQSRIVKLLADKISAVVPKDAVALQAALAQGWVKP